MGKQKDITEVLDPLKKSGQLYFIGIGGIGMSAIARYFHFHGKQVSGYDKTESVLTRELNKEGISVHYEDNPSLAPENPDLIVYTPAIPKSHKEMHYYTINHFPILKRSDILGIITAHTYNICISGTHGKTTVSTMLAHILRDSGFGCNAFLGGIAVNYNTNFWSNERKVCVVEADEYDRSFLKLLPDIAVITSMDPDHLDIYGTEEKMQEAFIEFTSKIKDKGLLFYKYGLPRVSEFKTSKTVSYHLDDPQAAIHAFDIKPENGGYRFNVKVSDKTIENVHLNMGGLHNVENASVSIAIAVEMGIESEVIRKGVGCFRGVKRRFEYILKSEKIIFIDDYAHHPEELRALIAGTKLLFKERKCTVIFQPHLFTRTRDMADGFAKSLDLADEIILLPIYPARESPIEGVSSKLIAERMSNKNVELCSKEEVLKKIQDGIKRDLLSVVVSAGAGDIDTMIPDIRQIMNKQ